MAPQLKDIRQHLLPSKPSVIYLCHLQMASMCISGCLKGQDPIPSQHVGNHQTKQILTKVQQVFLCSELPPAPGTLIQTRGLLTALQTEGAFPFGSLGVLLASLYRTNALRLRSNCTSLKKPSLTTLTFIDLPLHWSFLSKYWLYHNYDILSCPVLYSLSFLFLYTSAFSNKTLKISLQKGFSTKGSGSRFFNDLVMKCSSSRAVLFPDFTGAVATKIL